MSNLTYYFYFNNKKTNEVYKKYPNGWDLMIKRNGYGKKPEFWWWNKITDEVSHKKPETFDIELKLFKINNENNYAKNDSDDGHDDINFKQEIIKDYGEWKHMKISYSNNLSKKWWWNPTTEECQFTPPKHLKII